MSKEAGRGDRQPRRQFTKEFKQDAVQMLLDGHSATSVAERLGLSTPNLLYNWKRRFFPAEGVATEGQESRVRQLEAELERVRRERDILKKALSIFGRDG
jgi:transposase